MTSYLGRHAELYDLFYSDKPYDQEAKLVAELLSELEVPPPASLLELACGTGRHALEFERLGFSVVATDHSGDMLTRARHRAEKAGSHVEFQERDMRDLGQQESSFDAVVCLFDSIGYLQTNDAILQALRGAHRSLRRGGALVLEFWHAAAMLRAYDPVRVRRWDTPTGSILRVSETALDCARQTAQVSYQVIELGRDGSYKELRESQANRYFLVQEMRALMDAAGFDASRWCAGFSREGEITADTWHVVVAARRREP
jgi:ubiquinone/menaquinone biosynthesis C-methylase UbiE